MDLLVTHLTPLQLEAFSKKRVIPVVCSHGKKYLLDWDRGMSSSVYLLGYGSQCWYPGVDREAGAYLPYPDILLGQKLALEAGLHKGCTYITAVNQDHYLERQLIEYKPYFE